ncbi:uncharacterized protein LOC142490996 [Ascaphus truei]|uniref:uncharacterized protein LOC142490996 n=1 Tax=Ascaphus truei TaxID=8439 RepID=UPI003F595E79
MEEGIDLKTNFFRLEKLAKEEMKHWLDLLSLERYLNENIIPRGLRVTKKPTFETSEDFSSKWNSILEKCSFSLIRLLISYREERVKFTEKEIEDVQHILMPHVDSEEFQELDQLVNKRVLNYEKDIMERKDTKYQRDTNDYATNQVTNWKRAKRDDSKHHYPPKKGKKQHKYRERSRDYQHTSGGTSRTHTPRTNKQKENKPTTPGCSIENRFEVLTDSPKNLDLATKEGGENRGTIPKHTSRDPTPPRSKITSHTASFLELVKKEEEREKRRTYPLWDRHPTAREHSSQRRKRDSEEEDLGSVNKERRKAD